MTSARSNWWYCCSGCANKLAPFSGLFKELLSHRTPESRLLLIRGNGGLTNVNFQGKESINQVPTCVTPAQLQDECWMAQTNLTNIHCSNCDTHVGWKIINELSNHPIVRPGQYILRIDSENEIIYWERPRPR
ncbi:uncharacterized protein LOC117916047 [Vitis riparia]|uniref:uncharacterized protein LOC117916047 n=1 Tax=Vitis riparia TaxID=96939 RepID=UPI00155AE8DD|nr:uncharacterized protein LOC117916047 [Vitis riparia]